jgi:membrane associated rhomboid family serine protease
VPVATIVTATLTVAVGIAQTLAPVTGVLQRDAARVLGGEWWRLATTMFVHGGVAHLLFNVAGILLVGTALERRVGAWRWVVVYVASGVGAGLAEVLIDPVGVDTGASGGVAGLIGALLVVSVRRREPPWWPGWVYAGFFAVYLAGLAWGGVITGSVAGSLAIAVLVTVRRAAGPRVLLRVLLALMALGALALVVRLDVHGFGLVIGALLGLALAPDPRAPLSQRPRREPQHPLDGAAHQGAALGG